MDSKPRRGAITHPTGGYLREGDRYEGKLHRVERGQVARLKAQIDEAGGLPSLIPNYDKRIHGLDSGINVSFELSGREDRVGTPYATNLRLYRKVNRN